MSWRDGRDSCTCSCTLTGLPAQIPTELRRGSANKTQTVILEVPTCLTPHILTILRHKERAPVPSTLFIITYTIILYYTFLYCYTILCCMFPPLLGVLSRYLYLLYIYLIITISLYDIRAHTYTHARARARTHTHTHDGSIIYMIFHISHEYGHAHTHAHVRAYICITHWQHVTHITHRTHTHNRDNHAFYY